MSTIKLLARDIQSTEPICVGPFCNQISAAPTGSAGNGAILAIFGSTIGKLVNLFIIFAGLAMLVYLLWGAFDYVTSSGEKEKIEKARGKIIHATIGLIIVIAVLTLFGFIAGDILGIIVRDENNNWILKLPLLTQ